MTVWLMTGGGSPVELGRVRSTIGLVMLVLGSIATGASAQAPGGAAASGPARTAADVQFMQGMIGHHAQALVRAAMAPPHGAGEQVRLFARRIIRSQRDEIDLMESWLRERGERVPDASDPH